MPAEGSVIGRYVVVGPLGRGGMASVFLARQGDLDRLVALKELSAFHALDPAMAERFSREARVVASLSHPSIVTVYEFFEHEGVPYIAMEYVEGGSLRPHMGSLWLPQAVGVLEGVLAGLAHAHANGVVHRDLKPENVLVTPQGRVKLTDFGIAKAFNQVWTANYPTATGMAIGTPVYMAPEQAMGSGIGPWTDLYTVGVLAYEMLAGRPPFVSTEEPLAVLMKHVTEQAPPLRSVRPELDERLAAWVERLLDKAPDRRPSSAQEAWDELEDIIVALAGPMWRRDARVAASDSSVEAKPLTPVAFDESAPKGFGTPPTAAPAPTPPATPAAPATAATAPAPAAPARRRRGLLIGSGVAAVAVVAAVVALAAGGGGGGGSPSAGTAVKSSLPACLRQAISGLPTVETFVGVQGTFGKTRDFAGKRLAAVFSGSSGALGAVTADQRSGSEEFFIVRSVEDAACHPLRATVQGQGEYPNATDYDQIRFDLAGKHYAVAFASDGGLLYATFTQVASPGITVTTATRSGNRVTVAGTAPTDVEASTPVVVTLTVTPPSGPPVHPQAQSDPKDGRWGVVLRIPSDAASAPLGPFTAAFGGDSKYAAQVVRASVQ